LGDEAAARTTHEFQCVGHNVCCRFRLGARQGNVDQRRDDSHERPMQNEAGFGPPAHPERSQKAHDEGPRGSSVVKKIVPETQAERNNRENESYFREKPAEQNSSPVDCCATHFSYSLPHECICRARLSSARAGRGEAGNARPCWSFPYHLPREKEFACRK
jgi:hypothetical protein